MSRWKVTGTKTVFEHPRLSLVIDDVVMPDGKLSTYLRFAPGPGAVSILARNAQGKLLMMTEYSHPLGVAMYQLPGGSIEEGETNEQAAVRELAEEAGLAAGKLTYLGSFYMDNRRTTDKMFIYLAEELSDHKLPGDEEEQGLESFWLTPAEVSELIRTHQLDNNRALVAWALYLESADVA